MSIAKAELKIAITNDIGASIEDNFEAAKRDMYRQEGAVNAYLQAAKACETLAEHVKKDIDEGLYNLETGELINRYVARAAALQRTLHRQAENLCVASAGKIAGFESVLETLKKYRTAEQLRLNEARLQETATTPVSTEIVSEVRPGLSIKQRRQLEEQQAEKVLVAEPAKETESTIDVSAYVAEPAKETVLEVNGTSVMPKRRGRPPKNRD